MIEFFIALVVMGIQLMIGILFVVLNPLTDTILVITLIYTIFCAILDIPLIEILREGRY